MALALIQMINTALSLWSDERKTKYFDENKSLEAKLHEELKKPIPEDEASFYANPHAYRNNSSIDNIEFQLCNLSLALSSAVASKDARNKS